MKSCPECGQDLSAQTLPNPCPQCGFPCDPTEYAQTVLSWFGSWRGLLLLRVPAHAAHHLLDPQCRRIAVRRLLLGILLPWLVTTGVLVLLNGVTVTSKFERTWAFSDRPGEPIASYAVTHNDRLFNFNLHIVEGPGLLGYRPPPGAVSRMGKVATTWTLGLPDPDDDAWVWLALPSLTLVSLLGLLVQAGGVGRLTRIKSLGQVRAWPLVAAFSAVYVLTVVPILLAALCAGATLLGSPPLGIRVASLVLLTAAVALNAIGGAFQGLRMLRACRPRRRELSARIRLPVFVALLLLPAVTFLLFKRLSG